MQRFLPGRHPIESFGNGGFRLGGVSHQGSLLISASGTRALEVNSVGELQASHFEVLIAERADNDMLLIGTGYEMLALPKTMTELLRDQNIYFDVMNTNAAVRTYNVVLAEDRRVSAILMAVDKAYG
jgi:uncharacterized protein